MKYESSCIFYPENCVRFKITYLPRKQNKLGLPRYIKGIGLRRRHRAFVLMSVPWANRGLFHTSATSQFAPPPKKSTQSHKSKHFIPPPPNWACNARTTQAYDDGSPLLWTGFGRQMGRAPKNSSLWGRKIPDSASLSSLLLALTHAERAREKKDFCCTEVPSYNWFLSLDADAADVWVFSLAVRARARVCRKKKPARALETRARAWADDKKWIQLLASLLQKWLHNTSGDASAHAREGARAQRSPPGAPRMRAQVCVYVLVLHLALRELYS